MKRLAILSLILALTATAGATIALRYNTASQEIPIGIVLDSTNGNDEETGLTLAAADIHIWKAGGTRTFHGNAAATHMNNGIYYYVADANDTNTKGPLVLFNHTTGALAERVECLVYDPNEYDRLFSTGEVVVYSYRGVNVIDPNGLLQVVLHDISDAAGVPETEFPTFGQAVRAELEKAIDADPNAGSAFYILKTYLTANLATLLGTPAADVSADIAALKTVADAIQTLTDKVDAMLEADGPVNRFTVNALEQGPSGTATVDVNNFMASKWMVAGVRDPNFTSDTWGGLIVGIAGKR